MHLVHWASTPTSRFKVICNAFASVVAYGEHLTVDQLLTRLRDVVVDSKEARKATRQQLWVELRKPDRIIAEKITGTCSGFPGVWEWLLQDGDHRQKGQQAS